MHGRPKAANGAARARVVYKNAASPFPLRATQFGSIVDQYALRTTELCFLTAHARLELHFDTGAARIVAFSEQRRDVGMHPLKLLFLRRLSQFARRQPGQNDDFRDGVAGAAQTPQELGQLLAISCPRQICEKLRRPLNDTPQRVLRQLALARLSGDFSGIGDAPLEVR